MAAIPDVDDLLQEYGHILIHKGNAQEAKEFLASHADHKEFQEYAPLIRLLTSKEVRFEVPLASPEKRREAVRKFLRHLADRHKESQ